MTWYPNHGNRVSGIDQLTVVYDEFLYMLKKYWECEDNGQSVATCIQELNAVIVEADDEVDTEIICTKLNRRKLTEMLRLVGFVRDQEKGTDRFAERISGCIH